MDADQGVWRRRVRIGNQSMEVETGRLARQAAGAVLLRSGRSVLLVTAVSRAEPSVQVDFFPLTVEYREKMAGAGRIPGSFLRREARPGDHEVLGSRLIDRSIRPFFPQGFRCETQLLAHLLSFDPDIDAPALAITGASMALTLSDIPWGAPLAGIRVSRIEGEVRLFATRPERDSADLDLVVSVSREGLVMVEGFAREVSESVVLEALDAAIDGAAPLLELQEEMRSARGAEKRPHEAPPWPGDLMERARGALGGRAEEIFTGPDKQARRRAIDDVVAAMEEAIGPEQEVPGREVAEHVMREEIRRQALAGRRLDGRAPGEVRSITGEIGWLPGAHGSSVFTRGETQAMVSCTLGTGQDEQLIEDLNGVRKEPFLLHYNFPSYSVGEVRPLRGPGRREIGHGTLARRAILPTLPDPESFPFTIRLDSDIASSNGSSSMATVCGGCLALMDAGVPVSRPVAGVAMGLIVEGDRNIILTDILGDEDHLGDMDCKVAGTEEGITAIQMDNKVGSLPRDILERALEEARRGRLHILGEMKRICPGPRTEIPPHVPQVVFRRIRPVRIRDLIGPGGRHIQGIQSETGAKIDVEEDGRVRIFGPPGARLKEAERRVRYLTEEPRAGAIYRGRVTGVTDFGCFVEIFFGIEGLVHISELDRERLGHPSDVAAVGDEMIIKVLGANAEGKLELSRRAALGADPSDIEG